MSMRNHYYLSIEDLSKAHGTVQTLGFEGVGPDELAAAVQDAMSCPTLFERWRELHDEPGDVNPALAKCDPQATASAHVDDLHINLDLITDLPMSVVRHRMNLLIGPCWQLRDMRQA